MFLTVAASSYKRYGVVGAIQDCQVSINSLTQDSGTATLRFSISCDTVTINSLTQDSGTATLRFSIG